MGKDKQQIKEQMDSIATVHDLAEWVIKHGPFVGVAIDNDHIFARHGPEYQINEHVQGEGVQEHGC